MGSLKQISEDMYSAMKKHRPEILTGIGIGGMIITVITAITATPKALVLIENRKQEKQTDHLSPLETIKTTWKCYIPTIAIGATSVACLIGATSENLRRNAALATAYTLSESARKEYTTKVIETLGEKKEEAIRDSIAKDKIERNPVNSKEVIIVEKGNTLCYDSLSGRYFKSDIDKIKMAVNTLNRNMTNHDYVSLNDFYYEINLPDIELGDSLGWNRDGGLIEIFFSSQLTPDDTPCLVIDYNIAPKEDYC